MDAAYADSSPHWRLEGLRRTTRAIAGIRPDESQVGQGQEPALVVSRLAKVVPGVGIRPARCQSPRQGVRLVAKIALRVSAYLLFLEPSDVAQLPQWRVELRALRDVQ